MTVREETPTYTYNEGFAGIVTSKRAIEIAGIGWKVNALSEIDEKAIAVEKKHYPPLLAHYVGNVLTAEPYQADVVHVSPPCQPYSILGEMRGAGDPRALIGLAGVVWAVACNPRVIVIENVHDLATSKRYEHEFSAMLDYLVSHGYSIAYRTICTSSLGLHVRRNRLIIVATKGLRPGSERRILGDPLPRIERPLSGGARHGCGFSCRFSFVGGAFF